MHRCCLKQTTTAIDVVAGSIFGFIATCFHSLRNKRKRYVLFIYVTDTYRNSFTHPDCVKSVIVLLVLFKTLCNTILHGASARTMWTCPEHNFTLTVIFERWQIVLNDLNCTRLLLWRHLISILCWQRYL